jgi:hypothetical protein
VVGLRGPQPQGRSIVYRVRSSDELILSVPDYHNRKAKAKIALYRLLSFTHEELLGSQRRVLLTLTS